MSTPSTHPVAVRRASTAVVQPTGPALQARLCWQPADPLAVRMSFRTGGHWVDWALARELLAAGLLMPAGAGDVRLAPLGEHLVLGLDNGRARATLLLPAADVAGFLAATYRQIPLGAEQVDVDPTLALFRGGGAR